MQPLAVRVGCALWLALLLAASLWPAPLAARGSPSSPTDTPASELIYAAQNDGTLHVYDINQQHAAVKGSRLFRCCADVRGITAAAPTHRLYVMYNQANQGHVVAFDLLSDQVLWDRVLHAPGVDRGNVTPDGSTLYLPTWEADPGAAYELVIDAATGAEKARIALPPRSHDTIVSLDGQRVFMETKSPTASLYVADTGSNQVVEVIGGYCCSGVLAPFSINGTATLVVNQVNDYAGMQVAEVGSSGPPTQIPFASGEAGHGIAWTPDERQVWVDDGGLPAVHVFDMQATPPQEVRQVMVSNVPHWLTFTLDGRFAYVAGRKGSQDPTDVIDVPTYSRVGSLGPSEDLLEVDVAGGAVVAVGNQFGVGRLTSDQAAAPT